MEEKLFQALNQLVQLRNHKKEHGKDIVYKSNKEDAWKDAEKVLHEFEEKRAKENNHHPYGIDGRKPCCPCN
jgi:hypothetical protein